MLSSCLVVWEGRVDLQHKRSFTSMNAESSEMPMYTQRTYVRHFQYFSG